MLQNKPVAICKDIKKTAQWNQEEIENINMESQLLRSSSTDSISY